MVIVTETEKTKQDYKREAKAKVKRKFKIGEHYYLRYKDIINGSTNSTNEYVVIQKIFAINEREINSLIVKQVSGTNNNIFTLNKYDCKKLHVKYQPGLQVFSMFLNWIKKNENYY